LPAKGREKARKRKEIQNAFFYFRAFRALSRANIFSLINRSSSNYFPSEIINKRKSETFSVVFVSL
jgi:hypothetical protein